MRRFLPILLLVVAALATCFRPGATAADAGFKPLFDGVSLAGWDGDPRFWSVKDGAIRGETALDKLTLSNTFLIWRGGTLRDFELKLKVRLRNGNSGVQYRSQELRHWVVGGYQMEVDNAPGKSGFLYHERGRKYLALIGEKVEIDETGKPIVIGALGEKKELVAKGYYKAGDWNDYRLVARGNHLAHFLNGYPVVEVTDRDPKGGALEGLLALQIHAGPPMLVEYKDIFLKPSEH